MYMGTVAVLRWAYNERNPETQEPAASTDTMQQFFLKS
jgi:hypothetical protein